MTIIATAFTDDYEEYAKRLRDSVPDEFVFYAHRLPRDSRRWEQYCAMKPSVIHAGLVPGNDVLWLDADAEIVGDIRPLMDIDADFACYRDHREFRSGTVLMRRGASELLASWIRRCGADPMTWDQKHLADAWHQMDPPPKTEFLHIKYCQRINEPNCTEPAVILHHQASRIHRHKNKGG